MDSVYPAAPTDSSPAGQGNVAVLSTRGISDRDRYGLIREFYGRICMGVDVAPLQGVPLELDVSTLILPGVAAMTASTTPAAWERRPSLMADGNDDVCISWGAGGYRFARPGRPDLEIAPGTACIMPLDRPWTAAALDGSWKTNIQIDRRLLAERVPGLDDIAPDRIDRRSPEGALLFDYHWSVSRLPVSEAMAPPVAAHFVDLTALALGVRGDSRRFALSGGVRAARLLSIKRHVARNLHRSTLSARTTARALGISERYVRGLLADEGTSFSDYVADRRLDAIRHRLLQPAAVARPIADIAAELGFAEPSTFYRRFKARFGLSPSEMRRR
jgi:AraC-like DNA-binding protein